MKVATAEPTASFLISLPYHAPQQGVAAVIISGCSFVLCAIDSIKEWECYVDK